MAPMPRSPMPMPPGGGPAPAAPPPPPPPHAREAARQAAAVHAHRVGAGLPPAGPGAAEGPGGRLGLLLQEVVEERDLVPELQPEGVGLEELLVLLLELLPHQLREPGLHVALHLERVEHLLLAHVHLQALLDEVLHQLDVGPRERRRVLLARLPPARARLLPVAGAALPQRAPLGPLGARGRLLRRRLGALALGPRCAPLLRRRPRRRLGARPRRPLPASVRAPPALSHRPPGGWGGATRWG